MRNLPPYPNPWQTHSTEVRYDNPWIQVTEHQITNPSGGAGIYGKVHMKSHGAGVVVLDHADHTVLVGQWRYTLDEYSWEIPEGGGPKDEDPMETARRELLEETGLRAATWRHLVTIHTSNSITDEIAHVYLAQDVTDTGSVDHDATEDITIRRLPFREAIEMVELGRITDSMAVAGLLKAHAMRLSGELS